MPVILTTSFVTIINVKGLSTDVLFSSMGASPINIIEKIQVSPQTSPAPSLPWPVLPASGIASVKSFVTSL